MLKSIYIYIYIYEHITLYFVVVINNNTVRRTFIILPVCLPFLVDCIKIRLWSEVCDKKKKEKRGQKPRLSQSSFAFPSTLLASEKKETGERVNDAFSHVTHHLEINKKTFIRFSFSIILWIVIFASCSYLSNRKHLQY